MRLKHAGSIYVLVNLCYNLSTMTAIKSKRVQMFMDVDVYNALREFMKEKYGPNARNLTSTIQGFVIDKLREKGYWPPTNVNIDQED